MKTNTAQNKIDETLTVGARVIGNYMGEYDFAGIVKSYRFCDTWISYTVELDAPQKMFGIVRSEISISAGYSDNRSSIKPAA